MQLTRSIASDADRFVPYQLWQISKELKSGDVLLLRSIYAEMNRASATTHRDWAAHTAKASGFIPELVERHEKHLTDMLLLTPRHQVTGDVQYGHMSGISSRNNRLSDLGFRFCKNIETYEVDLGNARK